MFSQNFPSLLQRTKTIDVGGWKVSIDQAAPLPPDDVGNVLRKVQETDLRYLLERSSTAGVADCTRVQHNEDKKLRLTSFGLLERKANDLLRLS